MAEAPAHHPTFSIIVETENLATHGVDLVRRTFDSIRRQTIGADAAEILLVNAGVIQPDVLEDLRRTCPGLRAVPASPDVDTFGQKMVAAAKATGEILVFMDSDVEYAPDWLERVLRLFEDPKVGIAGSSVATRVRGPLSLAIALTWMAPQRFLRSRPFPSKYYCGGSSAIRRTLLLKHPYRGDVPLYRGAEIVQGASLRRAGYEIRIDPRAVSYHESPHGLRYLALRMAALAGGSGLDFYRARDSNDPTRLERRLLRDSVNALRLVASRGYEFLIRIPRIAMHRPAAILLLPLALPFVLFAWTAYVWGLLASLVRPGSTTRAARRHEELEARRRHPARPPAVALAP